MPVECLPYQDRFSDIEPILALAWGMCPGQSPQVGAPYELTDYTALVGGPLGEGHVDAVRMVLLAGSMSPAARAERQPKECMTRLGIL